MPSRKKMRSTMRAQFLPSAILIIKKKIKAKVSIKVISVKATEVSELIRKKSIEDLTAPIPSVA